MAKKTKDEEPLVLTDPVEPAPEPWAVDLDDVEHAVEEVIEAVAVKDVKPSETELAKMADRANLRAKRK